MKAAKTPRTTPDFFAPAFHRIPFRKARFAEFGIAGDIAGDRPSHTRSFTILDPEKASAWLPCAKYLPAGTAVFAPGQATQGNRCLAIRADDLRHFASPPDCVKIDIESGFVFMSGEFKIALRDGVDFVNGWCNDTGRIVEAYISDRRGPDLFFPASLLPPQSPPPGEAPRYVCTGDKATPCLHYLTQDVFPGTAADVPRSAIAAGDAAMAAKCPHLLPEDWHSYSPAQIKDLVYWNKYRSKGWMTLDEIQKQLGLSGTENPLEAIKNFTDYISVSKTNIPQSEMLYRPFTHEDLVRKGKIIDFIKMAFPDGVPFILRCIACDQTRALVVSRMLAAK